MPDDLNRGLLEILKKKLPNASPGALEELTRLAESNPLDISVLPKDLTGLTTEIRPSPDDRRYLVGKDPVTGEEFKPVIKQDPWWMTPKYPTYGTSVGIDIATEESETAITTAVNGTIAPPSEPGITLEVLKNAYQKAMLGIGDMPMYFGFSGFRILDSLEKPAEPKPPKKLEVAQVHKRVIYLPEDE